jgi:hypothetical protein
MPLHHRNWSNIDKIICRDNQHLMQLLNTKIQVIEGVSRTETFISLDQQIDRQIHTIKTKRKFSPSCFLPYKWNII